MVTKTSIDAPWVGARSFASSAVYQTDSWRWARPARIRKKPTETNHAKWNVDVLEGNLGRFVDIVECVWTGMVDPEGDIFLEFEELGTWHFFFKSTFVCSIDMIER